MLAKAARTRIRVRRNPPIEAERWILDPRGVSVLLTADLWLRHILRRHRPEMDGRYTDVVKVIQSPDFITRSPFAASLELYYGGSPRIRIVVRFTHAVEGEVLTAYPRPEADPRERTIWTPY